jgi:hypothetical protein
MMVRDKLLGFIVRKKAAIIYGLPVAFNCSCNKHYFKLRVRHFISLHLIFHTPRLCKWSGGMDTGFTLYVYPLT